MAKRIDLALVEWGLAPSRAKAQELIRAGAVEICRAEVWTPVTSPSRSVGPSDRDQIRIVSSEILKFVSRGGLKLEAALDHLRLDVQDLVIFDVGLSTGGFTDCLLQRGAARIVGVDVGSGQLAAKLRTDPRVRSFEQRNIRHLGQDVELQTAIRDIQFCVVDVSFISLKLVLPELARNLPPHRLLALVKPQFELSGRDLNKSGVVKDPEARLAAVSGVREAATAVGYTVDDVFPSRLPGGDGNVEYFLWASTVAPGGPLMR